MALKDDLIRRMAGSAWFRKVGPPIVPHLDRFVSKLTNGRRTVSGSYIPTLILHNTGARSGKVRETPLAYLPDGERYIVVGSNYGREKHPAWTANLLANPEAIVERRGRKVPVRARLVEGEEREELWPRLTAMWPVYDRYVEVSGRELRIFSLEPR